MTRSGLVSATLAERLAQEPALAIADWLDRERPIDPDAWSERVGFSDGARFVIVDLVEREGGLVATLGLDVETVINLGCSVRREQRRTWLTLTLDLGQRTWTVAPRFAEDDEPEF